MRQLFYQFVARDVIANKQKEYKRLGSIVNAARMAGLIDWDYMQDRTRNLIALSHWDTPGGVIEGAGASYHHDLWPAKLTMSKSGLRKTLLWESLRTFASVGTYRISPVAAIPVKVKCAKRLSA